jgi:DNA polymerase-3 subunit epsilon
MISEPVIVIDFETTGRNAAYDRATEVAAHLIENGRIVSTFHSLINPGQRLSSDIVRLTGITNEMLVGQPRAADIFPALRDFIGDRAVFAHKASFDFNFYSSELRRLRLTRRVEEFLCTMKLGQRLVPDLSSYRLDALARSLGVSFGSRAHRAAEDAEVCSKVLLCLAQRVAAHGIEVIDPTLLMRVAAYTPIAGVGTFLRRHAENAGKAHRATGDSHHDQREAVGNRAAANRSSPLVGRRWKLYPAGNLRDLDDDVLYTRDKLSYVGGENPFLMVMTERGEVRIPFRDLEGGDPRRILTETYAVPGGWSDSRSIASAILGRGTNPTPEASDRKRGAGVRQERSSTDRPVLPDGWTYFSPQGSSHSPQGVAGRKPAVTVEEPVFWFREPDEGLRSLLTEKAKAVSADWVYLKSQRFLLEIITQRVHHVRGWPTEQGAVTRFEVKGGIAIEIPTNRMLSMEYAK